MKKSYPDPGYAEDVNVIEPPEPERLRNTAQRSGRAADWRALGDAYFLLDGNGYLSKSIRAYKKSIELKSDHGPTQFRLGVALRRRSETNTEQSGDAQKAVRHWQKALSLNPNQYIWRRRLQQYGPRLDKPYNFYFWIKKARNQIRARGEEPVDLRVEPRGSEIRFPDKQASAKSTKQIPAPDPEGKIQRDRQGLLNVQTISTPSRVRPGEDVRVRVHFQLNPEKKPYWNNEAQPLTMSVDLPEGLSLNTGQFQYPNDDRPETRGERILEYEVSVSTGRKEGTVTVPGYVLCNVCEKKQGVCRFVRKDFSVSFEVDPDAPRLK